MIEEIILENDELIKGILDTIYTDIPKLTPVTSTLDKSYISYHLETGDYPLLTVNLNEQSIFPTGYLISSLNHIVISNDITQYYTYTQMKYVKLIGILVIQIQKTFFTKKKT